MILWDVCRLSWPRPAPDPPGPALVQPSTSQSHVCQPPPPPPSLHTYITTTLSPSHTLRGQPHHQPPLLADALSSPVGEWLTFPRLQQQQESNLFLVYNQVWDCETSNCVMSGLRLIFGDLTSGYVRSGQEIDIVKPHIERS